MYLETDTLRYVYMPLEKLYLVVLTTKNSNIIEDIEIIRQLSKIVQKLCSTLDKKTVNKKAFDLILSFDDVVTMGGYRDSVTASQLEAYLDMESTDEKIHKKMRMVREAEAKEKAKKHQKDIKKKRRAAIAEGKDPDRVESAPQMDPTPVEKPERPKPKPAASRPKGTGKRGMVLGKPTEKVDFSAKKPVFDFGPEEELIPDQEEEVKEEVNALTENVLIDVEERMNAQITKMGDIQKFEVTGKIHFTATDEAKAACQVHCKTSSFADKVKFRIPPDFRKPSWNKQRIFEPSQGAFVPGQKYEASIYKYTSQDETALPFLVNVWLAKAAHGGHSMTLEVEWNEDTEFQYPALNDIQIIIPLHDQPQIEQVENSGVGTGADGEFIWTITTLSEDEPSAILKLSTTTPENALFPLNVHINSEESLLGLEVKAASCLTTGDPISFKLKQSLRTEAYTVVEE